MVLLDALSAENGQMIWAIEMLNTLVVFLTEQALDAVLIFEIQVSQDTISLNNFVKYVEIQWQLVHALNLLDQLAANGAPDPKVVVQHLETLSAKRVSAMY